MSMLAPSALPTLMRMVSSQRSAKVTEEMIDEAKLEDKDLAEIATGDIYWAPLGEMSDEIYLLFYTSRSRCPGRIGIRT